MLSPNVYGDFAQELAARGLVGFMEGFIEVDRYIGCYFVRKNGDARIVFDTRLVNLLFKEAPTTALPSASCFAAAEASSDEVFMATCDVQNSIRCSCAATWRGSSDWRPGRRGAPASLRLTGGQSRRRRLSRRT
jgi:hypothetical protein